MFSPSVSFQDSIADSGEQSNNVIK